jgi:hypothetical protein
MTPTRRNPGAESRAASTSLNAETHSTPTAAEFDYDKHIVDRVDDSLWRAVFDGHFRLAVRCKVCRRWLVDGRSKRAQCGPRCAAKAKATEADE